MRVDQRQGGWLGSRVKGGGGREEQSESTFCNGTSIQNHVLCEDWSSSPLLEFPN